MSQSEFLNFETNYKNGKENGLCKLYYENGKVKRELSYVNEEIVNVKKGRTPD